MDDLAAKIAQLEALRATLDGPAAAALDDAIAALRTQLARPPLMQQHMEASDESSIVDSSQTRVAGWPGAENAAIAQGMAASGSSQIVNSPQTTVHRADQVVVHPLPPDPTHARQQRALLAFLRRTRSECSALPLIQLDPTDAAHTRPLELAHVYIGLHTTAQVELTEEQQEQLAQGRRSPGERATRPLTALEALARSERRRLVLLGAPGSGKSTFVSHLALCLAGAVLCELSADEPRPEGGWLSRLPGWNHGALPIRVILRDFAAFAPLAAAPHGSLRLLLDFLAATLNTAGCPEALESLEAALNMGRALLLFDGLDEVVGEAVLSRVTESIADASGTYTRGPILVTCRILDYQAEPLRQLPGFGTQTLADLTDEQVAQFVADWYRELVASGRRPAGQAHEDAQALRQAIAARAELRELARLPLLLTAMALVHANKGTLPDARALLYQECIELLLLRWRQPRGESDLLNRLGLSQFRSSDLLALMARLGFEAHEQAERGGTDTARPADLSERAVVALLAEGFAQYDPNRRYSLAQTVLDALARGNGLLLKRGPDVYAFPHRTFQEFLAGYHLLRQRDYFKLCLDRASQAHWHEALLLMAGYQVLAGADPEKPLMLAEKLLARGPVEQALAGELLNLIGRERAASYDAALLHPDGLWPRARATLIALATRGRASEAPALLRVRAALALGTLCYGSVVALARPGTPIPLPDPRLPLAVVGPAAARSANWRKALDAYWCLVEAGPFWYGDDRKSKPLHSALKQIRLPHSYKIARFPITNADFARFIADGGYQERRWWTKEGWRWREQNQQQAPALFDDPHFNNPAQPVVGVTWYEAAAYCAWLTAQGHTQGWLPQSDEIRLPTSLEWERAARHSDKRRYPWGNAAPDVERANYDETGIGAPSPVGCFPTGAAACGALDLAGNVMEWMATPDDKPEELEPRKDFTPTEGVLLSRSAFWRGEERLCCGARFGNFPYYRDDVRGFRVIWSLRAQE